MAQPPSTFYGIAIQRPPFHPGLQNSQNSQPAYLEPLSHSREDALTLYSMVNKNGIHFARLCVGKDDAIGLAKQIIQQYNLDPKDLTK